jgi:hypothetical protein
MEKRLNEQSEATWAMNETLNKFISIMSNIEAAKSVALPPPVLLQHVTTALQASETERKDMPSSHPVSCTYRSQHQTLSTSKCASIEAYPNSRADVQQASPSTFYGRSWDQERCALHPGVILQRNLSGELPLTYLPFYSLLSSISILYSLISSISTGSISSDCDHYGHSHVM